MPSKICVTLVNFILSKFVRVLTSRRYTNICFYLFSMEIYRHNNYSVYIYYGTAFHSRFPRHLLHPQSESHKRPVANVKRFCMQIAFHSPSILILFCFYFFFVINKHKKCIQQPDYVRLMNKTCKEGYKNGWNEFRRGD